MNKTLEIRKLKAGYSKKTILKNLSLSFDRGKLYALIGPNGSGKTTLLKTILKETKIQDGSIQIENKELSSISQKELSKYLSFVPQKAIVPEDFTVEEVLEMASYASKAITEASIQKALELCGIAHLGKRKAMELSGGELQLVLLARCISLDTPIILLDEPASSLDINNQQILLSLTKKLAKEGKTIIMTVHDLNSVFHYADEVIILKDGELYSRGKTEEVMTETMLKEVYKTNAKIHQTLDGEIFIS